jgi:hypothetical protein
MKSQCEKWYKYETDSRDFIQREQVFNFIFIFKKKYSALSSPSSSSSCSSPSSSLSTSDEVGGKDKRPKINGEQQVTSEDDTNQAAESVPEESLYETLNEEATSDRSNGINLSPENLAYIRSRAMSLSLPLMTALCNDESLIQSITLNRNKGSL